MTIPVNYDNVKEIDQEKGKWLLQHIYNPNLNTLEGLSCLALDRVQPHSFIRVYALELLRLCKVSKKSQELYTKNYKYWHTNETNMGGIGKRIMPVDKPIDEKQWKVEVRAGKTIDYSKYRSDNNKAGKIFSGSELKSIEDNLINTSKDERFKIPDIGKLPSIQYLFHYLMNRRSTKPDVLFKTFDVAQGVIQAGNNDTEGQVPRIPIRTQ